MAVIVNPVRPWAINHEKRALRVWLFLPFSLSLSFFLVCLFVFSCFAQYQGFHATVYAQGQPIGPQMNKDSSLSTLVGPQGLDFYPSCPKTAPKSKAKLPRRQIPLDPRLHFLKTELENHSSKISKTEWSSYLD